MDCPRDGNLLEIDDTGRHRRLSCPVCRGMFVAERDLTTRLGYKGPKTFESVAEIKIDSVADSRIRCPRDGATLKLVRFLDTELDVCPSCKGLWLDWGELEKIARRVERKTDRVPVQHRIQENALDRPLGSLLHQADDALDTVGDVVKAALALIRAF